MDHQSSLSIACLGAGGWQEAVNERTTIDEVFRGFVGEGSDLPNDQIISKSPLEYYNYHNWISSLLVWLWMMWR